MAYYKIRQDRGNRKPLPECRLTYKEWDLFWEQLNTAVESRNAQVIRDTKKNVKMQIRDIYIKRYYRDGECILCGDQAGYYGLCAKCRRSLTNNAILRSDGHTLDTRIPTDEQYCESCGNPDVLCKGLCEKCYGMMRSHGFSTVKELVQYRAERAARHSRRAN